ncbi:MAG TPA: diacylglycerol kinase family protein [Capsulimonadaceae bacterium]
MLSELVTPRRVALIINPTAGRGRAGRAVDDIRRCLNVNDVDAVYYYTKGAGNGESLANEAIRAGATVVAAVGGDGTLHEVTNAVMSAPAGSVALGLLPFGTGNDFARGAGLFGDLARACDALAVGPVRHIDIGRISSPSLASDRWFLVAAGLGFVADIAATVNRGLRRLHGAPAYIYGAAVTLRHLRSFAIVIKLDGQTLDFDEATVISISNVETTGGGLKIAPGADLADGLLDVCLVGKLGRLELLKQLPAVVTGKHISHPAVTMLRGKCVEIETSEPKELWIDGEVVGHTPATFTIYGGKLPMVLPAASSIAIV